MAYTQHPSLSAFTVPLTLLQLRLAVAVNKPVKFIRTSLKRLLASLSPPTSTTTTTTPTPSNNLSATIQALAFSARLEPIREGAATGGGNSTDALTAWRSVRELAAAGQQGGGGMIPQQPHVWVVAALAEARSILMTGGLSELSTAVQLLDALHPYLGVELPSATTVTPIPAPSPTTAPTFNDYPKSLKVLYRFLYCLVKSQTGHVKEAKAMLKSAHRLLDQEEDSAAVNKQRVEPDRVRVSFRHGFPPSTSSLSVLSRFGTFLPFDEDDAEGELI